MFAARWKVGETWSGPDWVKVWSCDEFGNVIREVEPKAILEAMTEEQYIRKSDGFRSFPSLIDCFNRTREDVTQLVDVSLHGKNLYVFPFTVVYLVNLILGRVFGDQTGACSVQNWPIIEI